MVDRSFARILCLASLLCVASVTTALAEEGCVPLSAITKSLAEGKYREAPVVHAIASGGAMLIVYAAADGATWTLVGIRPERPEIGCLLGSGTSWQPTAAILPGKPS